MRRRTALVLSFALAMSILVLTGASTTAVAAPREASRAKTCALPAGTGDFGRATPGQASLDRAKLQRAVNYANTHLRLSVQVFRHKCLVAEGAGNRLTKDVPYNVWSVTKSVVSLLTGIARQRGDLRLDDPIGRYLPRGYGDRAHRALTIRQLLTETAGLDQSILSEAATVATGPDVVREALAQPITQKPGTRFRYSQRTPDLLAFVVQRAVGQDLQTFAQRYLFGPVGIERTDYFWLRDRSGHTYGYAHLFMPPTGLARLGLLAENRGRWRGRQVVPARYLRQAAKPTKTNGCYGFLFWTNAGKPCTSASIPAAETVDTHAIPSAPKDLFAMVGAFQQNNFMIPSLGITVTWTGFLGDTTFHNLPGLLSASGTSSDLYYNFFRLLMRAVEDVKVPDSGPFKAPVNFDIDPFQFANPQVLLRDLFPSKGCNIVVCDSRIPTRGLFLNVQAIILALTS